jgi:hypothetical protein
MILMAIYQEEGQRRRERVHFDDRSRSGSGADDRTRSGSGASGIRIHTYLGLRLRN